MAVRSILTQVGPSPRCKERLRYSAALAKRLEADLIGVAVQDFSPYIASTGAFGYVDAGAVQAIRNEIDAEIKQAAADFKSVVAEFGVKGEWHEAVDDPLETLARLSRSADLVVASRRDATDGPANTAFAADLLVACGRPVLVVPPGAAPLDARTILVAWKDGREARRALTDALPMLHRASRVVVVEVCAPDDAENADRRIAALVHHLDRHQIKAEGEVLKVAHGRVTAHLVEQARQIGADLIVAGAYAHPRIREWVFGGVTQELLDGAPIPCLLSH